MLSHLHPDNQMHVDAVWTDDCQGKKDFDGPILSVSTRYWPRGGGFTELIRGGPQGIKWRENDDRLEIKPSATASLLLHYALDRTAKIASQEFEAETEEEVKHQVEMWARNQLKRVTDALGIDQNIFDISGAAEAANL